MATLDDLQRWMSAPKETEHLEFKEAKATFDSLKLVRYCAALANEGGGHLVMGVRTRRRDRSSVQQRSMTSGRSSMIW